MPTLLSRMTTARRRPRGAPHWERRGFVVVAVVVAFVLALALAGIWAQSALRERKRLDSELLRLQAIRLAEAGLRRGAARRAIDPAYEEETWTVTAADLGTSGGAEVRIRVLPGSQAGSARVEATAVFPAGESRRAQVTKQMAIRSNPDGEEP